MAALRPWTRRGAAVARGGEAAPRGLPASGVRAQAGGRCWCGHVAGTGCGRLQQLAPRLGAALGERHAREGARGARAARGCGHREPRVVEAGGGQQRPLAIRAAGLELLQDGLQRDAPVVLLHWAVEGHLVPHRRGALALRAHAREQVVPEEVHSGRRVEGQNELVKERLIAHAVDRQLDASPLNLPALDASVPLELARLAQDAPPVPCVRVLWARGVLEGGRRVELGVNASGVVREHAAASGGVERVEWNVGEGGGSFGAVAQHVGKC